MHLKGLSGPIFKSFKSLIL